MNKRKFLIIFLVVISKGFAVDGSPAKPQNIPDQAHWNKDIQAWIYEHKEHGLVLSAQWKKDGTPVAKDIRFKRMIRKFSYANGYLWSKEQCSIEVEPGDGPDQTIEVEKKFGKVNFWGQDNRIVGEMCYAILPLKEKDKDINLRTKGTESYPCGRSWEQKLGDKGIAYETYSDKCNQGCGEFRPLFPVGRYVVRATSVVFRDKPSTKGKSLGTLAKGTELQVIEDTHKIETHDFETAPWVKVKYDGKIGYVFGGFLDSLERNDL